jgi:hypothetical protein
LDKGLYKRENKFIKEKRHDVYQEWGKLPENSLCTECGVVFLNGRWSWNKPTGKVNNAVCPACRRSADNYPAGRIEIKGDFFNEHREEILNLISNIEKHEKEKHPLERIMSVIDEKDHTLVTTTGIHIARRIGDALSQSYKGEYSFQYAEGDKSIRVYWHR